MAHKYLGDIVVCEMVEQIGCTSTILEIPEEVQQRAGTSKARVLALGYVPAERRKAKKYYPQDDLSIGDIVLVPTHLGSRNRVADNPKAIIFDSEDVLGLFHPEPS